MPRLLQGEAVAHLLLQAVDRRDGGVDGGAFERAGVADNAGPEDKRLRPAALESDGAGVTDQAGGRGQGGKGHEGRVAADRPGRLLGEGPQRLGQEMDGEGLERLGAPRRRLLGLRLTDVSGALLPGVAARRLRPHLVAGRRLAVLVDADDL